MFWADVGMTNAAGRQGGAEAGAGLRGGRVGLLRGRASPQEVPRGLACTAVDHHLQQARPHEAEVAFQRFSAFPQRRPHLDNFSPLAQG